MADTKFPTVRLSGIKLSVDFEQFTVVSDVPTSILDGVSNINIFVGANNSGKSRFARALASRVSYEVVQTTYDLTQMRDYLFNYRDNLFHIMEQYNIAKVSGLSKIDFEKLFDRADGLWTLGSDHFGPLRKFFKAIVEKPYSSISLENPEGGVYSGGVGVTAWQGQIHGLGQKIVATLSEAPVETPETAPGRVYIPVLRGLRKFTDDYTDYYSDRTIKDYFDSEGISQPEIFTGVGLYHRLGDLKNGDTEEQELVSEYEKFISRTLFEGEAVTLTPHRRENVVTVKIGSEQARAIHHLGDGIQAAIILTFLPFIMQESQTFFFIEEPEMFMHPGLQRKLLGFYASLTEHIFFLTTHSNHLLDITIDIKSVSIFTFRKQFSVDEPNTRFLIETVDSGDFSSLELLGVRNSSVFLVNATIWVEGITDRWYFRKMLESYMDFLWTKRKLDLRLEEDVHYSFVEYGGANITHWSFLNVEDHPIAIDRLCAKAILIIDKDGEKKMERKAQLKELLKSRLIELPCREVENLLPYHVLRDVVSYYEKCESSDLPEFGYDIFRDKYLGTFIDEKMLNGKQARRGGYAADSGTLKDKVKFCEKALPRIDYETLPESTRKIVKKIYLFIKNQNES